MEIRRVDIENFRGIKNMSWLLNKGKPFVALIGSGDSSKSTILAAIDMALSDRWNLAINDTDFYLADIEQQISIRVILTDITAELKRHDVLGMNLCGIDAAGELFEDPEDAHEPCIVIALTIGKELEPTWTAYRPGKGTSEVPVTSTTRRLIGAYMVDERIDRHLRWSRTSALGRLTEARHGTAELLATAGRIARQSVANSIPDALAELTASLQQKLHELGSGNFVSLHPGLDQSLSNAAGNLALYEGNVPLTNYGLGSRRLAGVAAQQLAQDGKAVLLVDEIEYGLEPHRLVGLLAQLRKPGSYSHVIVTTHSPTALLHLEASDLAVVRATGHGRVVVQSLAGDDADLQALLRVTPEAFLARRVVLTEGKTEYGIALELINRWDTERSVAGKPSSAGLGVVAVESRGGTQVIKWATVFLTAGYEVVVFLDSDVAADVAKADALAAKGAAIIRWQDGFNTERAICDVLDANGLNSFIAKAVSLADDPEHAPGNYLLQLKIHGLPDAATGMDVTNWIGPSLTLETVRRLLAVAAHKGNWFKRVDKGRELASILLSCNGFPGSDAHLKILTLQEAVYASIKAGAPQPETAAADQSTS